MLWDWILVEILRLGLVNILNFKFSRDADVWLRFWSWCLIDYRYSKDEIWSRVVFELVIWPKQVTRVSWTEPFGSVVPLAMFEACKGRACFAVMYLAVGDDNIVRQSPIKEFFILPEQKLQTLKCFFFGGWIYSEKKTISFSSRRPKLSPRSSSGGTSLSVKRRAQVAAKCHTEEKSNFTLSHWEGGIFYFQFSNLWTFCNISKWKTHVYSIILHNLENAKRYIFMHQSLFGGFDSSHGVKEAWHGEWVWSGPSYDDVPSHKSCLCPSYFSFKCPS